MKALLFDSTRQLVALDLFATAHTGSDVLRRGLDDLGAIALNWLRAYLSRLNLPEYIMVVLWTYQGVRYLVQDCVANVLARVELGEHSAHLDYPLAKIAPSKPALGIIPLEAPS